MRHGRLKCVLNIVRSTVKGGLKTIPEYISEPISTKEDAEELRLPIPISATPS